MSTAPTSTQGSASSTPAAIPSSTPATTTTSSSTSSSFVANPTDTSIASGSTGGVSSSLYLFTFLITIVVLAVISAALLLRASYVRRQFQRRVEEAIRNGRPLPSDAAVALGLGPRGRKKEKKHGPMPGMWEAEMWRNGGKWEMLKNEKHEWDDFTPLSITHTAPPVVAPPPLGYTDLVPVPRGPWFLRPFLFPRFPDLSSYAAAHPDPNRPDLQRTLTGVSLPPVQPAWTIPEDGEDMVVSVLIALPVEGREAERWNVEDVEETEVPEVCLGVMACTAKGQ